MESFKNMKTEKKKILISGSYGTGNVGDEVILSCLLQQISEYDVTILSQGVDYTKTNFPGYRVVPQTPSWEPIRIVKDLLRFRYKEIIKRIRFLKEVIRADVFWLGGGGLLAEMVPTVLRFYIHQIKLAKFFGCKTLTFAVGVGPLKSENGKRLLASTMNGKVDFISVRDEESSQLLKSIGVNKNIKVVPDPAFLFNQNNLKREETKIIFNFYPAFVDPIVWPGQQYRLEKLKDVIIEATRYIAKELNYQVVYLPFGTSSDSRFAQEMEKRFKNEHPDLSSKVSVYSGKDFKEITQQLLSCRWSITMRFHAGLISLVNLIPSICIDQQFKSERVLEKFNLLPLLVSLPDGHHKMGNKDIDIEELKTQIKWIQENYPSFQEKIAPKLQSSQKELTEFYVELRSLL